MSETSTTDVTDGAAPRPADSVRSVALLIAMVAQVAAGAVGGIGVWGEQIGTVANSYPTPLLPGGGAFAIWSLIYVSTLALAVRAALPAQRGRRVYRRAGWWLVAAGVLNAGWVLVFGQRWIAFAEVVIVALLICLIMAWVRLTETPARDWGDRLLLYTPVTFYAGWVTMATVVGAATTVTALGLRLSAGLTASVAVAAVLATTAVVTLVVINAFAVFGFVASVTWALAWIVLTTSTGLVAVAALVGIVVTLSAVAVRYKGSAAAGRRLRIGWG
ncbi:TspO-like protein [Actinoalloteichus sp. GBA129-24]|uniref:TspO and MBR-related protein n=2 Tax=Pseudonocardiaceae TaxID=2070 RepID=A0AAC9LIA3_9PSEU|nr:TspO and MBR-related protein [Actinoalloteichus fjordicus]APU22909.1 TspO-like protein [Actinoalloteichus sp. GBA129-24]